MEKIIYIIYERSIYESVHSKSRTSDKSQKSTETEFMQHRLYSVIKSHIRRYM